MYNHYVRTVIFGITHEHIINFANKNMRQLKFSEKTRTIQNPSQLSKKFEPLSIDGHIDLPKWKNFEVTIKTSEKIIEVEMPRCIVEILLTEEMMGKRKNYKTLQNFKYQTSLDRFDLDKREKFQFCTRIALSAERTN